MIASFACRETRAIFERRPSKLLAKDLQKIAYRKLVMIHIAGNLLDLRVPPGNRLEALRGVRAGQHSIRVNDQWRVCFTWREGRAYAVEIVDYH
jgi:proteic killer suppression protein